MLISTLFLIIPFHLLLKMYSLRSLIVASHQSSYLSLITKSFLLLPPPITFILKNLSLKCISSPVLYQPPECSLILSRNVLKQGIQESSWPGSNRSFHSPLLVLSKLLFWYFPMTPPSRPHPSIHTHICIHIRAHTHILCASLCIHFPISLTPWLFFFS